MSVTGKRCLVTGSSDPKSIGYACAKALIEAGASSVTISGRDKKKNNEYSLQESATALGSCCQGGIISDLSKPETMKAVVDAAAEQMGGLDILIIAGCNGGSEYLGMDTDNVDSYRKMQDVAVHSPMMLVKAAVPYFQKQDNTDTAAVVMVSSMASHTPWPDTAPYNLAKAAQNCLVQTLAFQYRTMGIRVNAVLPACIHTGFLDRMAVAKDKPVEEYAALRARAHPLQRNGTPEEVAQAVLWLASPQSSFTTGELLKIDGGLHLSNWFNQPKILKEYVGGTNLT